MPKHKKRSSNKIIAAIVAATMGFGTLALGVSIAPAVAEAPCPEGWFLDPEPFGDFSIQADGDVACNKILRANDVVEVPDGITEIAALAIGGGGAGGAGGQVAGLNRAGGGGGAGELKQMLLTVVDTDTLNITVGAGGLQADVNADIDSPNYGVATNGGNGGASSISINSTLALSASPGLGGSAGTSLFGGTGGASGGISGQSGGSAFNSQGTAPNSYYSSGGGGGGHQTQGTNGIPNQGGHGGFGPMVIEGLFGLPEAIDERWSFEGLANMYGMGMGGAGGSVVESAGCSVGGYSGYGVIAQPFTQDANYETATGQGSCYWQDVIESIKEDEGYSGFAQHGLSGTFPGQGGSGGAGIGYFGISDPDVYYKDEAALGTAGIDGAVWLRFFIAPFLSPVDENGDPLAVLAPNGSITFETNVENGALLAQYFFGETYIAPIFGPAMLLVPAYGAIATFDDFDEMRNLSIESCESSVVTVRFYVEEYDEFTTPKLFSDPYLTQATFTLASSCEGPSEPSVEVTASTNFEFYEDSDTFGASVVVTGAGNGDLAPTGTINWYYCFSQTDFAINFICDAENRLPLAGAQNVPLAINDGTVETNDSIQTLTSVSLPNILTTGSYILVADYVSNGDYPNGSDDTAFGVLNSVPNTFSLSMREGGNLVGTLSPMGSAVINTNAPSNRQYSIFIGSQSVNSGPLVSFPAPLTYGNLEASRVGCDAQVVTVRIYDEDEISQSVRTLNDSFAATYEFTLQGNCSPPIANTPAPTPPNQFVTFRPNGGLDSQMVVGSNSPAPLSANWFKRSGYVFTGWNTQADGKGVAYADGATFDFKSSMTLYAQWSLVKGKRFISTFAGNKATLTASMKRSISSWVNRLPSNAKIVCQGSTSGVRVTAFDRRLASNRAKNVCSYAASIKQDLTYKITTNPSSATRFAARHVWMYFN